MGKKKNIKSFCLPSNRKLKSLIIAEWMKKNSQPNEKKNYSLLYMQYPWTRQMHLEHNWTTIKQKKKEKNGYVRSETWIDGGAKKP